MAGVAGAHLAGSLCAVERQRIRADLLAPEGLLEADLQLLGLPLQGVGAFGQAELARARGGEALGGIDVALHLDERDRPLRQAAVGMKDRVVGVLPTLVGQPRLGCACVLDEAVAIEIALLVDPRQRTLDRRPQRAG